MDMSSRVTEYLQNIVDSEPAMRIDKYYRYNAWSSDLADWEINLDNTVILGSTPKFAGAKLYLYLIKSNIFDVSDFLEGVWNEDELVNIITENMEELKAIM